MVALRSRELGRTVPYPAGSAINHLTERMPIRTTFAVTQEKSHLSVVSVERVSLDLLL